MDRSIVGTRIRMRRRDVGISQAELARQVGISASYLNLIEWNKRPISAPLSRKIALTLNLAPDILDGSAERRLLDALQEIAHLPQLAALSMDDKQAGELIGRFPAWARALAALARAERQSTLKVQSLSERLMNDPFLGESVHHMLTRIAAIRSAAEILVEYGDVEPARRERFHEIIYHESQLLSDTGEALAQYFDKADAASRILTPLDEVESLFDSRNNHFSEIETAAAPLSHQLTGLRAVSRADKARELTVGHLGEVIQNIVNSHTVIETGAAQRRATQALERYAVGAILLPMAEFHPRAAELSYDIEALADVFSVAFEAVCQRLTALPRTSDVPKFGYFQANAAGAIIDILAPEELAIPRYATACPLWALYRAQQTPNALMRQRALFPSGARFIFLARARNKGPTGFGQPRHYVTDMLTMTESDAEKTIYTPNPAVPVEEVGPSCRLCARTSCLHRVEDPLAG